jgi:hypothetical protein
MVLKSRKTTKNQWKQSYRMARIICNSQPNNEDYLIKLRDSDYLAWYHVKFMINANNNYFDVPLKNRLYQRKLVDEIINEILEEERLEKERNKNAL